MFFRVRTCAASSTIFRPVPCTRGPTRLRGRARRAHETSAKRVHQPSRFLSPIPETGSLWNAETNGWTCWLVGSPRIWLTTTTARRDRVRPLISSDTFCTDVPPNRLIYDCGWRARVRTLIEWRSRIGDWYVYVTSVPFSLCVRNARCRRGTFRRTLVVFHEVSFENRHAHSFSKPYSTRTHTRTLFVVVRL